jgi:hypothetical protein
MPWRFSSTERRARSVLEPANAVVVMSREPLVERFRLTLYIVASIQSRAFLW